MKLFLFFLFTISVYSEKLSINFSHIDEKGRNLKEEEFAGYNELNRWALHQNLKLYPDSSAGGIRDGICRMIPSDGLSFYLESRKEKINRYLYLDLTVYENISYPELPVRTLNIYVAGRLKSTVTFKYGEAERGPFRITVEPSDIESGRINVRLVPGGETSTGKFWGIWDVFLSDKKDLN